MFVSFNLLLSTAKLAAFLCIRDRSASELLVCSNCHGVCTRRLLTTVGLAALLHLSESILGAGPGSVLGMLSAVQGCSNKVIGLCDMLVVYFLTMVPGPVLPCLAIASVLDRCLPLVAQGFQIQQPKQALLEHGHAKSES